MTLAEHISKIQNISMKEANRRIAEADVIIFEDERPVFVARTLRPQLHRIGMFLAGAALFCSALWWTLHILNGGLL
jgi:hypothetical protein